MRTQITGTNIGAQQRLKVTPGTVDDSHGRHPAQLIHIVDGQTDFILDVIGPDSIIYENHHKSLEDLNETFTFKATTDGTYMEHIVKGNRVLIPHEDNESLVEFTIEEVEDVRGLGQTIEVHSIASFLSLRKSKVVRPETATYTAQQWVARTLAGSDYIVGVVESGASRKMEIQNHTTPYNFLRTLSREFELEVDFTVEHNGIQVIRRLCNMYDRVGMWRGREITFGQDLKRVVRKEEGDIFTALLGLGPEPDEGKRLEVLVEDNEALQRWGRPGPDGKLRHLIGVYEPESDREDMSEKELRQYTRTELNKRNRPKLTYEVEFIDLENVMGEESKLVRFGDTLRIKDTVYEPNIFLEARVFEINRSVFNFRDKEIVLGDFEEFSEDEVFSLFALLKGQIDDRVSIELLKKYAEPKRIESPTPPTGQTEHVIWVDTSKKPYVAKVYNGGEWVAMSPTTAAEINAYNKQQADAQRKKTEELAAKQAKDAQAGAETTAKGYADEAQKKAEEEARKAAEQARKDAEAFAKNAANITEGVIDVGQVPLRTSVTGARLEWDGLNGLVQYDQKGDPTSWLDLKGNAHFANAFLSGRVEALEGYFGENLILRDGQMSIIRPDGAVSNIGGLVKENKPVIGFEPRLRTPRQLKDGSYTRDTVFNFEDNGFWFDYVGEIDGRSEIFTDHRDPDKEWSVRLQRYDVFHDARYLVIGYDVGRDRRGRASQGQHTIQFWDVDTNKRLLGLSIPKNSPGYRRISVDLGVPTYEARRIEMRLRLVRTWNNPEDEIHYRINRIFTTDFP